MKKKKSIVFNKKLIEASSKPSACIAVLSVIDQGGSLGELTKESIVEALNDLLITGAIIRHPETKEYKIVEPLYRISGIRQDTDVQELRLLFSKKNTGEPGLMGRTSDVKAALADFYKENPTVDSKRVFQACKAYVSHIKSKRFKEPGYPYFKLHNFINKELISWVEDEVYETEQRSFFNRKERQ